MPYHTINARLDYLQWRSLCPQRMATVIGGLWPEHLNSPANTYYQTRPVITMTSSLVTTHWGRFRLVHRIYYPVLAWPINLQAYAMPSVPPIILLTDMVPRNGCRLLAAHGLTSCPIGEDPAAHGHWCAFTDLYHTIPYHTCLILLHVYVLMMANSPLLDRIG